MIMNISEGMTLSELTREINMIVDQINNELKSLDMGSIATSDGYSFEQMKIPSGGRKGEYLKKASDKPYDVKWE